MTQPGAPFVIYANDINDRGEFVGEASDATTATAPAFFATPVQQWDDVSPAENTRQVQRLKLPAKVRLQRYQKWGLDLGAD